MTDIRFGRAADEYDDELTFGEWGTLPVVAALDAFDDTHAYFDTEQVRNRERTRGEMIRAARRYYDGEHVKALKVRRGEPDDNILVNLCRALIDDSVSWLFGDPQTGVLGMKAVVPAGDSVAQRPGESAGAETWAEFDEGEQGMDKRLEAAGKMLEDIYDESGGFHLFKRWGIRASVAGHFFIKIVPEAPGLPRLVVLDPRLTTVRTNPADMTDVMAFKVEWRRREKDSQSGRKWDYLYRQLVVRVSIVNEYSEVTDFWLIADFKAKDKKKRDWVIQGGPWAWPWNWCPIVDGPNLMNSWDYYGLSDLEDVTGLNDSVNFVSSNYSRILKHHAHPKTIGTGVTPEEIKESGIDSFWTIPNTEAKLHNLEMQSDLQSSLRFLEFLRTSFWAIGRGLDPSTYKDQIGRITNFGLRVLAVRAMHKMSDKRLTYGKCIRQINANLCEMLGLGRLDTVIEWPDALPENPTEKLQGLMLEMQAQVTSRQTATEELGRSWELEQARIAEEAASSLTLGEELLRQFELGQGKSPFGEPTED